MVRIHVQRVSESVALEESNHDTIVGSRIGKYSLIRELGSGASGTVYLAEDTTLGREVALKVMHPQLARDREFLARFKREARLVASLAHPNVVRIHAFDILDGQFVIDTEFLAGGPLSAHCARSIFDGNTVARVARDVLAALEFCHSRDILHRDIKPSNILLDDVGNAQVADFGIAKALEIHLESSLGTETSTGIFLGTPRYAPPEAWEGEAQTVQSDIYSLGVVLHEMVTGRPPYEAHTPLALMREMLTSPVCKLDPVSTGLSPALADLVNDMVSHRTSERPVDAGEALERLRQTPEGMKLRTPEAMFATQRILVQRSNETKVEGPRQFVFDRRTYLLAGSALLAASTLGYALRSSPWFNSPNAEHIPELKRVRYIDAVRSDIPPQAALNTLWHETGARVYSGESVSPARADTALWCFTPQPEPNVEQGIVLMPSRIAALTLNRESGQVSGGWAAFEDGGNTILRYGSVAGKLAGNDTGRTFTLSLERFCEQDQAIESETWHLDMIPNSSDLGFWLGLEANPRLQLLLFDELVPRRLPWAREMVSQLPALRDKRVSAEAVDAGSGDSPGSALGDTENAGTSSRIPGLPLNLGATCVLRLDGEEAAIEFTVPGARKESTIAEIALSPVPGVTPDGQRQRPVLVQSRPSSSERSTTSLYAAAPAGWTIETNEGDEGLIVQLRIPVSTVPTWMRRHYWRMNAHFDEERSGKTRVMTIFGAPEFSAIEHGVLLFFEPTISGWP